MWETPTGAPGAAGYPKSGHQRRSLGGAARGVTWELAIAEGGGSARETASESAFGPRAWVVLGPPRLETRFYSSCSPVNRNAHVCSPPRSSASERQWVGPPLGAPPPRSRSLRLPGESVERPVWPAADLQYSSTWKLLFKDSAPSWGEPEKKAVILEFSEDTPRKEPALHTHAAGKFFILQTGTGEATVFSDVWILCGFKWDTHNRNGQRSATGYVGR